ncbi:MAG: class I SAM-dependent methyltransferase [Acidobacteria bacterium]|nr:class I SAM-dependent methyltransferase [Acidobacteriota bacterium]
MDQLAPNHHADYPQFAGPFGYVAGLTMTVGRGRDARLVADMAGLKPTDHVLDLGCGPGTAARMTARGGVRVTGVDPSKPMLALARLLSRFRKPSAEIDWVRSGAENLLVPDDAVTTCWSLASVHHWPDLERGLQEVHRVLSPGGLFLALEKRTQPGAKGNASHGWTADQAKRFASMLAEFEFSNAEVTNHDLGRRKVVVVIAHKAETA